MSLINEALKKAQRQRAAEQADYTPPVPGGGSLPRRREPRNENATLLLAAAAVVLVVLTAVGTVFFLYQPTAPAVAQNVPAPVKSGAGAPAAEPAPAVTLSLPATPAPIPPAATPIVSSPPVVEAAFVTSSPVTPAVAEPALVEPPAPARLPAALLADKPAAEPTPDPHVYAYIDALRITGVRASGDGSRVLMNDRVYRVNDIIERTMNIQLIKVDTGHLTFTDPSGATYIKYF